MLNHKCFYCKATESHIWHTIARNPLKRIVQVITICDECYKEPQRRYALTDWERKKLSFYKDDRKWQEDISGRVSRPDGKVNIYDGHGNLKEIRD